MKKNVWRAVIEVAFIIFLFYPNLLMGDFGIAMVAALIGYSLFEFRRKKF
jgi:hypothetical protein